MSEPTAAQDAYSLYEAALGESEGTGAWLQVGQERINAFADVTQDHQFIHVDPQACAERSPWKVPIAHGFLTLSLLPHLIQSIEQPAERLAGLAVGINYGFDKVRFLNPVKVGSRIRASSVLSGIELKDENTLQLWRTVTVEIEGDAKPALAAEWISRAVYT